MRSGRGLLLDTHIWYWYVAGSADLAASLRGEIDRATGTCWYSPISLWELGMLAHKGRVRLRPDPEQWIRRALERFPMREAVFNGEVAIQVGALETNHPDPGDRFLAATAKIYGLTLVTMDHRLIEEPSIETLTA